MNIDNLTQTQIDALTGPATATIKVVAPTVAGSLSFTPMAGAVVKINGVSLVAGVDWTAATSAAATATSLAAAITTATADVLCTAAVDGVDTSLVVLTANSDGPDGNSISLSMTMPDYTFPSGPALSGGALPLAGDLVYNTTESEVQFFDGSDWIPFTTVATAWGDITGTLSAQTDLQDALDDKEDALPVTATISVISGDPVAPEDGQIWFDTGTQTWRGFDGDDSGTFTFTPDA